MASKMTLTPIQGHRRGTDELEVGGEALPAQGRWPRCSWQGLLERALRKTAGVVGGRGCWPQLPSRAQAQSLLEKLLLLELLA